MSDNFLTVDGEPVSVAEALRYLQAAGQMASFVGEILRQHVLEREIRARDVAVNPALVELAIADYRAQRRLENREQLEEWLTLRGQDPAAFRAQIERDFRLEILKQEVTDPLLAGYFADRKPFLDRVALSQLTAASRQEAVELGRRLVAEEALRPWERIVHRIDLPPLWRDAVEAAAPGEVIGPFELGDGWAVVRFDRDLPASPEDPALRERLREELFEGWLGERIELLSVELGGE